MYFSMEGEKQDFFLLPAQSSWPPWCASWHTPLTVDPAACCYRSPGCIILFVTHFRIYAGSSRQTFLPGVCGILSSRQNHFSSSKIAGSSRLTFLLPFRKIVKSFWYSSKLITCLMPKLCAEYNFAFSQSIGSGVCQTFSVKSFYFPPQIYTEDGNVFVENDLYYF